MPHSIDEVLVIIVPMLKGFIASRIGNFTNSVKLSGSPSQKLNFGTELSSVVVTLSFHQTSAV